MHSKTFQSALKRSGAVAASLMCGLSASAHAAPKAADKANATADLFSAPASFAAPNSFSATSIGALGSRSPLAAEREPSGGRWKPILLSGDDLPLSAPPSSAGQLAGEIAEVLAAQSQRTAAHEEIVRFWDGRAVVRWNEIARSLVIKHLTAPPIASRVYALLSVAQYDALVMAWRHKYRHGRLSPSQFDRRIRPIVATPREPNYPSEAAVVAAASAGVLEALYPDEVAALEDKVRQHEQSRLWAGVSFRSDLGAGDALGRAVAARVMNYAQNDNADATWTGTVPVGVGKWNGVNPALPMWGGVRTWLVGDVVPLRPPAPPAFHSPAFKAALDEVRRISDTRTPEQLRIAQFWADGAGTYTPPGHWNAIACALIDEKNLNELRAARTLSLMNMAVEDAGICCWDAKFTFWLIRPFQADPAITTPVGKPNFPSYTSGHASFSGAASEVLSYLFPRRQTELRAMAEEAALSRLYGGIHFRFDNEVGLAGGRGVATVPGLNMGRKVALSAIRRGQNDGAPTP